MPESWVWVIGVLLFVWGGTVWGQQPVYTHYTVEDGLANSIVYAAIQDSKGYLWFGTEDGACRFDGYSFSTFSVKDGLPSSNVFRMYEDSQGRIWLFTNTAIPVYFFEGELYHPGNSEWLKQVQFKSESGYLRGFYESESGDIWIGNSKGEMVIFPANKEEPVTTFDLQRYECRNLNDIWKGTDGHMRIYFDRRKHMADGWESRNLILDLETEEIEYKGPEKDIFTLETASINPLDQQTYFSDNLRLIRKSDYAVLGSVTPGEDIIYLTHDRKGDIWMGSYHGAKQYKENESGEFDCQVFLPKEEVTSILQDREGNYWFTTRTNGVFMTHSLDVTTYTMETGLPDNKVYVVYGDSSGNIWGGLNRNNYVKISPSGSIEEGKLSAGKGRFTRELRVRVIIPGQNKNEIYLGGTSGILRLNGAQRSEISNFCRALLVDHSGQLLFSNGYMVIGVKPEDFENGTYNYDLIEHFKLQCDAQPYCLLPDGPDRLVIGAKDGLLLYDGEEIHRYPFLNDSSFRWIKDLKQAESNGFWMATQGWGIGRVQGDSLQMIGEEEGLVSNNCNQMYLTSSGELWVATNKGISRVKSGTGGGFEVRNFGAAHGLPGGEVYSIHQLEDRFLLGTTKGITVFREADLPAVRPAPSVLLTHLRVNDQDTTLVDHLEIPWARNRLEFHFTGICFSCREEVQYRYRLEGAETDWHTSTSREAAYSFLPAGSYRFVVSATNQDGQWSPEPASMRFTILAPIWQKTWFLILCIAVGLTAIAVFFLLALRNIQRKNRIQTKIKELQHQALSAQMNPHFVFNSLNSIHYFISQQDTASAHLYLAKLGKLIRGVMEASRESVVPLEHELDLLEKYLSLESMRMEDKFSYELTVGEGLQPASIQIPPLLIQPMVENALLHGIRHKTGKGTVIIRFELQGTYLHCQVEDDGVGRNHHLKRQPDRDNEFPSLGLKMVRERIQLMESQESGLGVHFTDLKDAQGKPAGSRVDLYIPLSPLNLNSQTA